MAAYQPSKNTRKQSRVNDASKQQTRMEKSILVFLFQIKSIKGNITSILSWNIKIKLWVRNTTLLPYIDKIILLTLKTNDYEQYEQQQ